MNHEIITVDAGKFSMDCIKIGTGAKSFVMLPGLSLTRITGSAITIAAAYKDFCEEYTIYCFDRINDIPEGYTVRQMAADTAEAMKILGITDAYIFGASQGGMIGQYIAIDYPELVGKLFLASSYSRCGKDAERIFDRWIALAKEKKVQELNHDFFESIYSDEMLEAYKDALPALEKVGTAEDCKRFVILAEACKSFDAYGELDRIKCPVLVIGSDKDKVLTGKASREIAEKIGCEIYMYSGYGHAVYDEAPDYKDRIAEFFKS